MTPAVVLQARMGSTRLPGKVLMPIAGRSVLAHCVERLQLTSGLAVIVATTTEPDDDAIAAETARLGVAIARGSVNDVLGRFAQVVREHALTHVIRATADNPAVDLGAPVRTLTLLRRARLDYVVERGLPYGAAVEAMTGAAILEADRLAVNADDREHVTPFIKRSWRGQPFRAIEALAPGRVRRPQLRFTVDTPDDLEYMRRVYAFLPSSTGAPLEALIAAAERMSALDQEQSGATAR